LFASFFVSVMHDTISFKQGNTLFSPGVTDKGGSVTLSNDEVTRLTINEAAYQLKKSVKTIYEWAKKHDWKMEYDEEGKSCVWVPNQKLNPPASQNVTQGENKSDTALLQIFTEVKLLYEDRLKDKEEVIRQLEDKCTMLNRELENRNTMIQKYREADPKKPWWKWF
jgi:hypothetical protein